MQPVVTPGQEVIVVGAGPTGLTIAAELYRHGVACRVVDASDGPTTESRAFSVQPRTLEVYEDMGLLDEVLAGGARVFGLSAWVGDERIVHVTFDELDAPYPFVLSIPQSETERLLEAHLERLGGKVERGVTLTDLSQDDDRVAIELSHADGRSESAFCGWLLGCDGARSAVRKAIGQEFSGDCYEEQLFMVDAALDWAHHHDEVNVFLHEEGTLAAFPLPGGDDRYRIVATPPAGSQEVEPTLEWFQELITRRAAEAEPTLSDPVWLHSLHIHHRLVDAYRTGQVFLVGDAAHVHSPVGGQNMNTGIQDAYNLAWKLALVIQRRGLKSLLDSYHLERRPIAEQVRGDTDFATKAVMLRHPVGQALRNEIGKVLAGLEVVQRRVTRQVGQLTFSYRRSPIVGEERSSILTANLGASRYSEAPNVRDWIDFGAAPLPGDRAPDARAQAEGQTTRVFDLLRGTHHTLLLFDGGAPTKEGYENLRDIARRVSQVYGERIKPWIVVPHAEQPEPLCEDCEVVLDPEGEVHSTYGAGAECLYLIRPDGYVGFRAQPASESALYTYLHRVFPKE